METLFIWIALLIAFDIASFRFGYDSSEKANSPEWERRADRDALHDQRIRNKGSFLRKREGI